MPIKYKNVDIYSKTNIGYEKIVWSDGDVAYYLDGKHHREDGPAFVGYHGRTFWAINGKIHREDGPAEIGANGSKNYWLNDKCITPENYHEFSPLQLAKLGLI